jgi:hypothetical protein
VVPADDPSTVKVAVPKAADASSVVPSFAKVLMVVRAQLVLSLVEK